MLLYVWRKILVSLSQRFSTLHSDLQPKVNLEREKPKPYGLPSFPHNVCNIHTWENMQLTLQHPFLGITYNILHSNSKSISLPNNFPTLLLAPKSSGRLHTTLQFMRILPPTNEEIVAKLPHMKCSIILQRNSPLYMSLLLWWRSIIAYCMVFLVGSL